ncbi:MAG: hypothetical protein JNN31_06060 [Dechloromonas sp.]|jgi:hypothetical protein|nr:hypothetical protein [Dechloromonas sp.]
MTIALSRYLDQAQVSNPFLLTRIAATRRFEMTHRGGMLNANQFVRPIRQGGYHNPVTEQDTEVFKNAGGQHDHGRVLGQSNDHRWLKGQRFIALHAMK